MSNWSAGCGGATADNATIVHVTPRRRRLIAALWLGVVLILVRIASGGALTPGSFAYAFGTLPALVAAWLGITCLAGAVLALGLVGGREWTAPAGSFALATVPLGVILATLDHDSGLIVSALAAGLVIVTPWTRPRRDTRHRDRDERRRVGGS